MAENRNAQQVREITDKLEQGIKELFESDRFKEYLTTMSKFYNYSFNNTLLIAMQKPDATLIAGYTAWQRNFDRHVMKGEKGNTQAFQIRIVILPGAHDLLYCAAQAPALVLP